MARSIVACGLLCVALAFCPAASAQGVWFGGIGFGGPGLYGGGFGPYGVGNPGFYGGGFGPYGFMPYRAAGPAFVGGYPTATFAYPAPLAPVYVARPVVGVAPAYVPRPAVRTPLSRAYRRAWRRGW